jgi:hypothetical protein
MLVRTFFVGRCARRIDSSTPCAGRTALRHEANFFFFRKNCTCKDFTNQYDHKKFYVARGLTHVGPSPRDGMTLAFTFVRRTQGGQEESSEEEGSQEGQEGAKEEGSQEGQAQGCQEEEVGIWRRGRCDRSAAEPAASILPAYHDEKESPGTADRAILVSWIRLRLAGVPLLRRSSGVHSPLSSTASAKQWHTAARTGDQTKVIRPKTAASAR